MSDWHVLAKLRILQNTLDVETDDLVAMLVRNSYVDDHARDFVDDGTVNDPATHELTAASYARQPVANVTLTRDDVDGTVEISFDPVEFGDIEDENETIGGVVIFLDTGDDATNVIIWYDELEQNRATNDESVTYEHAAGYVARV